MPNVLHTKPSDWKYVSEGGATIVFSYQGPSHPHFDGTVLRLRKAIVPAAGSRFRRSEASLLVQDQENEGEEPDDPTIEYQTKCMEKLIPQVHLPKLENVALSRAWLEDLVELHDVGRPEARRDKDQVDLNRRKGVLATDLVGGQWLAVEIKPKWAFLPSLVHLSDSTKEVKGQTCRFCMHSHFRLEKGEQVVTEYCPLDLFSGVESRVRRAIHCLWDAWVASDATVNNLKIFSRGKFVKPAEANLMLAENQSETDMTTLRDHFTTSLLRPLLQTPILAILSTLQRNLDVLDIEGLSKLWRETEASAPLYRTTFSEFFESQGKTTKPPSTPIGVSSLFLQSPEPGIPDWIEFLDTYLSQDSPTMDYSNPSAEDLRYYLLSYLLSATFKDCSIIVRLGLLRLDEAPQDEIKPENVTVIDLDPKSMDKLRGWEKLDKAIAQTYSRKPNKKVCVDEWRRPGATPVIN